MPGPTRRKKPNRSGSFYSKVKKTKRRVKDLDEIQNDLVEENAQKLLNQEIDLDKPGCAQFYCLQCARYFIDQHTLDEHCQTKAHKKQVKSLQTEAYSIEESERAAGHGSMKTPKTVSS